MKVAINADLFTRGKNYGDAWLPHAGLRPFVRLQTSSNGLRRPTRLHRMWDALSRHVRPFSALRPAECRAKSAGSPSSSAVRGISEYAQPST
jgi:hypothetical protein